MGNWDLIVKYDEELSDWFEVEGCQYPQMKASNRLPTTRDVIEAMRRLGHDQEADYLFDDLDWNDPTRIPESGFKARGDRKKVLHILKELSRECGQLCLYPDTGEAPIIVDPDSDVDRLLQIHISTSDEEDSWQQFALQAYDSS
jgi:hypothetical protein